MSAPYLAPRAFERVNLRAREAVILPIFNRDDRMEVLQHHIESYRGYNVATADLIAIHTLFRATPGKDHDALYALTADRLVDRAYSGAGSIWATVNTVRQNGYRLVWRRCEDVGFDDAYDGMWTLQAVSKDGVTVCYTEAFGLDEFKDFPALLDTVRKHIEANVSVAIEKGVVR